MDDISGGAEFVEAIREISVNAAGTINFDVLPPPLLPGVPANIPVAYRAGASPEILNLKPFYEQWRTAPERRTGTARATTLASFCALANRHKDVDSAIFAESAWPAPKLTAILDYHKADGSPRFGQHRIEYAFPLTEEFSAWIKQNGEPQKQADFAEFIEDHAAELASPTPEERTTLGDLFKERVADPSDLIALSRGLEIHVGAKIKRQERLQSGERVIQFDETHSDAAGNKVDVPGIFMIAVPAFVDGVALRLPARLRYRPAAGDILWTYQLYRWREWLRQSVQAALKEAAGATELPAYEGQSEK